MLQDVRFALRLIAKERWYSAVAILALALGIGVNATVYAVVDAALFRPLPFKEPGRLYTLSWQPSSSGGRSNTSYPDFLEWRQQTRAFGGLAAFTTSSLNISDDRLFPEQVRGASVTPNLFELLGHRPIAGRGFLAEDDRPGANRVVVLGERIWRNRYSGDLSVLGTTLRVNGEAATVVGVMPGMMQFPNNAEVWVPFIPTAQQQVRTSRPLNVIARLRDGASLAEAQAESNAIAARLAAAYPDTNKQFTRARIETFKERFAAGNARVMFLVLLGAVGVLLLIACANVANLLLSRSAHRAREIAVRMAMGATRVRILRQLLLESVILAFLGGLFGLIIAMVGVPMIDAAIQDPGKPYWIIFKVDYAVLAYIAGVCILTGILFGLAPALHVSRGNLNDVLNESGRGTAGGHRAQWMSSTMVVVELALTILLLVGAGLMIRSFMSLYRLDIGITTDRLMAMRLQLPQSKYPEPQDRQAFYDRLEPRLIAIAGVDAIAVTTAVPPFGTGRRPFEIEGRPARQGDDESLAAYWVTVGPQFFDVVRAPVSRGRVFNAVDGSPANETVIISQRMAAQFFPGEDPLGRRIRFTQADPASGRLQSMAHDRRRSPTHLVQLAAGAAAARRRLRSTAARAAWRRHVAREKPVAAGIGHRCHSKCRAVGRSRPTSFHDSDA